MPATTFPTCRAEPDSVAIHYFQSRLPRQKDGMAWCRDAFRFDDGTLLQYFMFLHRFSCLKHLIRERL